MASSRNSASRTVSHGQSLPIPASPQRGRRRSPVAARAVLKAALELLDDHAVGYQGLTMKAVAERAGVSKATLYRWWPDKRHLVLDAYRSRSARDIPVRLTGDLRADLAAHLGRLAFILNNAATARTLTDIIVGAAHDPSFGRLFAETLLHERRAAILAILVEGRARGQVGATADLEVAVDAAFGALHHRLLVTRDRIDGPFVTALTDLIVHGVAA